MLPGWAGAVEALYLGGQFGYGAYTASSSGALGFGGEIAVRTNPVLDLAFRSQFATHGGVGVWANTIAADLLVGQFNDFEVFIGGGPGIYSFGGNARFGLRGDLYSDLVVSDTLRLGLGWHFHGIFSPAVGESSFWTVMARIGFSFGMGQ